MTVIAILSALWLGILTSVSPVPVATNITALAFICKNLKCYHQRIFVGIVYVFGRTLSCITLGLAVVSGLLAMPSISSVLQATVGNVMGPLIILIGLILLDVIKLDFSFGVNNNRFQEYAQNSNFLGFLLLGIVFGLSFGPVSAAIFFGSFTPLAVEYKSRLLLPAVYGIGTGLPVVILLVVMAFSANKSGKIDNIIKFNLWFKKISGGIFVIVGIYFIITNCIQ